MEGILDLEEAKKSSEVAVRKSCLGNVASGDRIREF